MLRVADFAALSDLGRVRKANEDAYFVRSPLFVVADGMGGAKAGEVASKIASEAFVGQLDEKLPPELRLAEVVRLANREIHTRSNSDRDLQGMGTTLTAVLVGEDEITVAHVGDSRAYRLRDGELVMLTRDHSLVGEMVRRGAITEREAERHPQRSILTRALGPDPDVEVDTNSSGIRDGDIYLLTSDGLTGMVSDAKIAEVANSGRSMREVADELIRLANQNGGVDNITVIAFSVTGRGAPLPTSSGDTGSETIVGAPAVVAFDGDTSESEPAVNGRSRASNPGQAASLRRAQTRRPRLLVGAVIATLVLVIAAAGAVIGSMNVYFIGVDQRGLVTMYRGLPYELPFSLDLYTRDYVSTKPASELRQAEREVLFDHKLRSRDDAADLITEAEQGTLETTSQ